ncbi:MAG: DUF192 domain-containing protein [Candidatus Woesearchaeota archaeon]
MKSKIISKKIFIQNNIFTQATGLMFRKNMKDFAMIFPFKQYRKIGITMHFVFFPIDAIFLDNKGSIVDLKENLKPFLTYWSKIKSSCLIELPKGYIKKFNLKVGSKLKWDKNELNLVN